jgi:hypothetical protein
LKTRVRAQGPWGPRDWMGQPHMPAISNVGSWSNPMWMEWTMRSKGSSDSRPMRLTMSSLEARKRKSAIPSAGTTMQPRNRTASPSSVSDERIWHAASLGCPAPLCELDDVDQRRATEPNREEALSSRRSHASSQPDAEPELSNRRAGSNSVFKPTQKDPTPNSPSSDALLAVDHDRDDDPRTTDP